MRQRGDRARLALEARECVGVFQQPLREHFHGDVPSELRVARPVHLAHPPAPSGARIS